MRKPYLLDLFGVYKKNELKKLVYDWIGEADNLTVLKTDLFEEALGPDQFLFEMFKKNKVFGIDISKLIVEQACLRSNNFGRNCHFNVGDIRNLPYKEKTFDIIISNSTLDHFAKGSLLSAFLELKRVLKENGKIILTINNKHNIIFYIMSRIGIFLNIVPFPVEFYTKKEMKKIFSKSDLKIERATAIVHLISPINRILLIFNYILGRRIVDNIARHYISIAEKLRKKRTKFLTGWFLAFLLTNDIE